MEVVPFAWIIAFATRRASEWFEREPGARSRRELAVLAVLAVLAPLMRAEGAVTSVALGAVVAAAPRVRSLVVKSLDASRAEAVLFLAAALLPNLLFFLLTGAPTSSTAQVKLFFGNPYYALPEAAIANARTLVGTILDGQVWSAEFLPKGGFECIDRKDADAANAEIMKTYNISNDRRL